MKDLPSFYSKIDSYEIVDGKILFNLKFNNAIQYENNKVVNINNISVVFGYVKNNVVVKKDYYELNESDNLNIPNYESLKKLVNYDSSKDKLYYNIYK